MYQPDVGSAETSVTSETCQGSWQQVQLTFPDLPGMANDMPSEKPYMRVASTTWIDRQDSTFTDVHCLQVKAKKQLIHQVLGHVVKIRCACIFIHGQPFGSSCCSPGTSNTYTLQGSPTCKIKAAPYYTARQIMTDPSCVI